MASALEDGTPITVLALLVFRVWMWNAGNVKMRFFLEDLSNSPTRDVIPPLRGLVDHDGKTVSDWPSVRVVTHGNAMARVVVHICYMRELIVGGSAVTIYEVMSVTHVRWKAALREGIWMKRHQTRNDGIMKRNFRNETNGRSFVFYSRRHHFVGEKRSLPNRKKFIFHTFTWVFIK